MASNKGPGVRKDSINFVNARPSSEKEKLKIQRLVRAHVGRWISDQSKDRVALVEAEDEEDQQQQKFNSEKRGKSASHLIVPVFDESESPGSLRSKCSSTSLGSSSQSSSTTSATTQLLSCQSYDRTSSWAESRENDSVYQASARSFSKALALFPHSQIASVERYGVSLFDPFHTYPSPLPPEMIHSCESYCFTVLWPTLTPAPDPDAAPLASSNWFPHSIHDPALFTSFLYGSLSHQRVQWLNGWIPDGAFTDREQRLLELVEFQTLKLVNEAVAHPDPARALSDGIILCVISMIHNRINDNECYRGPEPPFTAPFRRLQWIDIYGSQTPNMVHVQGLIQIIMMRGGPERIELVGLGPIISFSDIFTACTLLTPPMFPFLPLNKKSKGLPLHAILGFDPLDVDCGFGQLQEIGLTRPLADVLHAMHAYVNIVEDYLTKKQRKLDVSLLIDRRNFTMYNLLSLPPRIQPDASPSYEYPSHDIVYEACRLTALIYGVGVIFPLPGQSTPLARLAGLLRNILELPRPSHTWESPGAGVVFIWVLTLGSIAAEHSPHREWFVAALGQAVLENRISSWFVLRKYLGLMIWYDRACDQPGQNLWLEVCSSLPEIGARVPLKWDENMNVI